MTLSKAKQSVDKAEKESLISDIKKNNPTLTKRQIIILSKTNIDDLRKINEGTRPVHTGINPTGWQPWHTEKGARYSDAEYEAGEFGKPKMQYGGVADMSAAPMVKQQRQRKRRAASGFRAKYSKGGGVRASKYKL